MKVYQISNIKQFMNQFLLTELFDHFLLQEGIIQTYATFHIDGKISSDYWDFDSSERENLNGLPFLPFSYLRENCKNLIKGQHPPVGFRFSLLLSPENLENTIHHSNLNISIRDISSVYMNLRFSKGQLTCTSGVSYKTFSLEHDFEQYWDGMVGKFLTTHQIEHDII